MDSCVHIDIIKNLGDHSVPAEWAEYVKKNDKKDAAPGAPIAWESPSQPEEVQPGYGYVADNNGTEETFYYHSDHLGSTSYVTDDSARITQYTAYLPYGELLVDEHTSSEDLPYKFNGKELDEETGLYYYGARYMNPTVGLFLNPDRYREKYPFLSAYNYCAGNPINMIDVNGDSLWVKYNDNKYLYQNGQYYNEDGSLYNGEVKGFLKIIRRRLGELESRPVGASIVHELQSSKNEFTIVSASEFNFKPKSPIASAANIKDFQDLGYNPKTKGCGGIISYGLYSSQHGIDENGNTSCDKFIALGHEMAHACDANNGLLHCGSYNGKGVVDYPYLEKGSHRYYVEHNGLLKSEWRAVYRENLIRKEHKMALREYYFLDDSGYKPVGTGPRLLTPNGEPINY